MPGGWAAAGLGLCNDLLRTQSHTPVFVNDFALLGQIIKVVANGLRTDPETFAKVSGALVKVLAIKRKDFVPAF